MLLTETSLTKPKKHIKKDLKLVVHRFRANKLKTGKTGKTEIVIFKSRDGKFTKQVNFGTSGP